MGIFATPKNKALAAAGGGSASSAMIGEYFTYTQGELFNRAMSVPAYARAVGLISSVIGSMKFEMYNEIWNEQTREMECRYIAPRSWLRRINPATTNNFMLSWTVADLVTFGRAFWFISSRTNDGYPASFSRLPAAMITSTDQTQNIWFSKASNLYFNGSEIPVEDVVQFLSGSEGVVYASQRTINTAIKLDEAVFRNASSAIPSGILQVQPNSESMSATDLQELAATFNEARMTQTIAALSPEVHYQELMTSPDKMMLVQSSEFMQMQVSRIVGVPAYLLNLSVGSYAYTNSAEARQDVWTFAAKNVAECISQTLSMNQVLPNGTYVKFDISDFVDGDIMPERSDMPRNAPANNVGSDA
jgi:hypothetical protein